MRYENCDQIYTVLKRFPRGATAAQVAERIGARPPLARQRLNELYRNDMILRLGAARYRYRIRRSAA